MSAILSELKNFFSSEKKDEDEFVYFWDDIYEMEQTYIETEEGGVREFLKQSQLLILHVILFLSIVPLLIVSFSSEINPYAIAGFIIFLLALVISYFVTMQSTTKPLRIINENIGKLANNDLSGSDELIYNKETYEVLDEFDSFRINLSMNLQALKRSSMYYQDEILRLQHKISQTSTQLDRINLGLDNSLASASQYQNLTGNVNKVSDGIDLLTSNFDSALNGIDEISSIVSSIGKQTTMLALNAGIEAARAGEYGRGFEVVASNLRRLAQHAVKSSNDISNMSKEINTNAKEALEAITQGMSNLRRNLDQDHNLILEYNTTIYNTVLQLNNIVAEERSLVKKIEENTNFLDNYDF